MGRGPISQIKKVYIFSDTKETDMKPLEMAVGIPHGTDIRSIDLNQINNRMLKVPGVKNSATRRMPNGNIIIQTKQHHAVALFFDGLYYYPLSEDKTKIDTPSETRDENSIVFRGNLEEMPDDLTEIIKTVSVLSEHIDYMDYIEARRWNLHTKNGITIYLPENNPATAINKINILNQTHKLLSRELEIIDLRNDARILVKTRK
jgi:cell division protein FtsQ